MRKSGSGPHRAPGVSYWDSLAGSELNRIKMQQSQRHLQITNLPQPAAGPPAQPGGATLLREHGQTGLHQTDVSTSVFQKYVQQPQSYNLQGQQYYPEQTNTDQSTAVEPIEPTAPPGSMGKTSDKIYCDTCDFSFSNVNVSAITWLVQVLSMIY